MAANQHPTEDSNVWKAKCVVSNLALGRARSPLRAVTAARTQWRALAPNLSGSESIGPANECAMPSQECRGAHLAFSFKLHFGKRKCSFSSGNDQIFVAAQNFSGFAFEVDN